MLDLMNAISNMRSEENSVDVFENTETLDKTTENKTIIIPGISSNIPKEYDEILIGYQNLALSYLSGDFWNNELGYNPDIFPCPDSKLADNWGCMVGEAPQEFIKNGKIEEPICGYVLKDINNDGVIELFLVRKDYFVLSVFTIEDGKAKLLDAYWNKYKCRVLDSGELYTMGSGGVISNNYTIWELDKDSKALVPTRKVESYYEEFFEIKENQKILMDQEQINEFFNDYPFKHGENWTKSKYYPIIEQE